MSTKSTPKLDVSLSIKSCKKNYPFMQNDFRMGGGGGGGNKKPIFCTWKIFKNPKN